MRCIFRLSLLSNQAGFKQLQEKGFYWKLHYAWQHIPSRDASVTYHLSLVTQRDMIASVVTTLPDLKVSNNFVELVSAQPFKVGTPRLIFHIANQGLLIGLSDTKILKV